MNYPRVWVENPNRARGTQQQEASKYTVIMLKLVKLGEEALLVGTTFEGDPIGFKPSAYSDSFETCKLFKRRIYNNSNRKHIHDIYIRSYNKMNDYALI